MPDNPTEADMLMAHYKCRKITDIAEKVVNTYREAAQEYSHNIMADEAISVCVNFIMNVLVIPLATISPDPPELRKQLAKELAYLIETLPINPDDDEMRH
jgi:hypothetical protein